MGWDGYWGDGAGSQGGRQPHAVDRASIDRVLPVSARTVGETANVGWFSSRANCAAAKASLSLHHTTSRLPALPPDRAAVSYTHACPHACKPSSPTSAACASSTLSTRGRSSPPRSARSGLTWRGASARGRGRHAEAGSAARPDLAVRAGDTFCVPTCRLRLRATCTFSSVYVPDFANLAVDPLLTSRTLATPITAPPCYDAGKPLGASAHAPGSPPPRLDPRPRTQTPKCGLKAHPHSLTYPTCSHPHQLSVPHCPHAPAALQHSRKALAHSPQRPRRQLGSSRRPGSLYRGKRVAAPQSAQACSSTRPAPPATSCGVGRAMRSKRVERLPHMSHGNVSTWHVAAGAGATRQQAGEGVLVVRDRGKASMQWRGPTFPLGAHCSWPCLQCVFTLHSWCNTSRGLCTV